MDQLTIQERITEDDVERVFSRNRVSTPALLFSQISKAVTKTKYTVKPRDLLDIEERNSISFPLLFAELFC